MDDFEYQVIKREAEAQYDKNDTLTVDEKRDWLCKRYNYTHGLVGVSDTDILEHHRVIITSDAAIAKANSIINREVRNDV